MRPSAIKERSIDDASLQQETGRTRKQWFEYIAQGGAQGRAAIGKALTGARLDPWWISTLVVEYEQALGLREKDGRPKGYSLCMTKTVASDADRVYAAFVTSDELSAWFGPSARIDAVVGGNLEDADGTRATVRKLRPDKTIVLQWHTPHLAPGSEVEVLLQSKAGKCGIIVNHTRVQTRYEADLVRSAWEQALVRLKQHIEG